MIVNVKISLLGVRANMSYNVDRWSTKRLENLVIPIKLLYGEDSWETRPVFFDKGYYNYDNFLTGYDFTPEDLEKNLIAFDYTHDGSELVGYADEDKNFHVLSATFSGMGSGRVLYDIIEPALKESTGTLIASRIWESGDAIDRITCIDGDITTENIDI